MWYYHWKNTFGRPKTQLSCVKVPQKHCKDLFVEVCLVSNGKIEKAESISIILQKR